MLINVDKSAGQNKIIDIINYKKNVNMREPNVLMTWMKETELYVKSNKQDSANQQHWFMGRNQW